MSKNCDIYPYKKNIDRIFQCIDVNKLNLKVNTYTGGLEIQISWWILKSVYLNRFY